MKDVSTESDGGDPEGAAEAAKRKRGELRPFPRKLLSEAIKIVMAIKENNAGKPWPAVQVADAIGRKQRSSDFQYIIAAARDFGLIEGNVRSEAIQLTDLGRDIGYPTDSKSEKKSLFKAFSSISLFRLVYEYYEGSPLPEIKYLDNTLIENFKLPLEHVDEFRGLFIGNCKFLEIDTSKSVKFIEIADFEPSISDVTIKRNPPGTIIKSGRRTAFVIMPFVERNQNRAPNFFKEVFNSLIRPAAVAAGFEVEWANQLGSDIIQSTVINKILDADLVLADLTDHNPNVLFELGIRLADNKGPVSLVKTSDTGRLFDVDNMMRVYEYNSSLWSSTLQIDIPNMEAHVRAAWENKDADASYIDILRRVPVVAAS